MCMYQWQIEGGWGEQAEARLPYMCQFVLKRSLGWPKYANKFLAAGQITGFTFLQILNPPLCVVTIYYRV